jgi:hypothetical protein
MERELVAAPEAHQPTGVDMRRRAGRDDLNGWRAELDEFYDIMNGFGDDEDGIFRSLSAMSARASQIRSRVVRKENRQLQVFRTQEIDPFLKECDRQFKIWSREHSVSQFEWETTNK